MPRPESTRFAMPWPWRLSAAVGGAAWCAQLLYRRLLGEAFPAPFYWSDVALVSLLAALPLVAQSADWLRLAFARDKTPENPSDGSRLLLWLAALICALLLPWLYVQARCRHDLARLDELTAQSRVGEAAALARGLAGLAPSAAFRGLPMKTVAAEMTNLERELRQRTSAPLPAGATDEDRRARARDLAQLGNGEQALATLASSSALSTSHEGNYLRGLVYLDRSEFADAVAAFQSARQSLAAAVPAPDIAARKIELIRQEAYCQRKLGRYAEAEAAYRELLKLDPSADTHFLLAQFYQDAQQANSAQFHARQAMTLDADRYAAPGQRLIDNLITSHFGCWGVFASESKVQPTTH